MRNKLILATTAGLLALGGGLAFAVPALADDEASTTREERIRDALAGLVEDGSITGAQADEVAGTLAGADLGGHGGHGGGRLDLSVAATALDMAEDELRDALRADDTSLADVAGEQGVEVDALVDALVEAQQERIAQAVEDGDLTQTAADERLADLEERVTERVHSDDRGHRGPGNRGGDRDGDD
jgi:predicted Rossmann fold nucleotide-binding protein DprA/Smf involved in DNA uptake